MLGVQGEIHVIGAEAVPVNLFSAYGFSGELVPVVDPDSAITLDALWDNVVTKTVDPTEAAATNVTDFDWDTADGTPDVEPGEVDVNDLSGLLDSTKEIFAPRIEWMSFAKGNPIAVAPGSPDTYTPRSFKSFRSSKVLVADMPSYALIAFSNPSLDQEATAFSTHATTSDWAILENLRNVMNDFWRINTGMVEAGAESPYAQISSAIGDLVSPVMVNPAASLVNPATYTVMCHATWLLDLPGSSIPDTLDPNNE